jgi:hypothetical protein
LPAIKKEELIMDEVNYDADCIQIIPGIDLCAERTSAERLNARQSAVRIASGDNDHKARRHRTGCRRAVG